MPSCPQQINWINRPAPKPNLVVQMRCGAPARRTHRANPLADGDALAGANLDIAQMCVSSLKPMAVVDLDRKAIAGPGASVDNSSLRGRHHRRPLEGSEIKARVEGGAARERIDAAAIAGGFAVIDGDGRGQWRC